MKTKKPKAINHEVEPLLTVKEVITRLHISRVTLHKLTTDGKIKSVKLGRSVRYNPKDVNDFINQ